MTTYAVVNDQGRIARHLSYRRACLIGEATSAASYAVFEERGTVLVAVGAERPVAGLRKPAEGSVPLAGFVA